MSPIRNDLGTTLYRVTLLCQERDVASEKTTPQGPQLPRSVRRVC